MTPAAGNPISFGQIAAEFGVACSNLSMSNFYRETSLGNKCTPWTCGVAGNTDNIPTTGTISFCNFYSRNAPTGGTCQFFCNGCIGKVSLPAGCWQIAAIAIGGGGGGGGPDGAASGGSGGHGREVCGKGIISIATCGAILMYSGLGGSSGVGSASYAAGGNGGANTQAGIGCGGIGGYAGCVGSSGGGGGGGGVSLISIACCDNAGTYSSCFYFIAAGGGGGGAGAGSGGQDCLNVALLCCNGNPASRNLGTTTTTGCIQGVGWNGQGENNIRDTLVGTVCNYDGGGGGGGGGGAGGSQNWGQLGSYTCVVIKGGYYWCKTYNNRTPEGGGAGFAYHNTAWPVCNVTAWTSCSAGGVNWVTGGVGGNPGSGGTVGYLAVAWCSRVLCCNLPGPSFI